jgi:FkbM family methyltransferase
MYSQNNEEEVILSYFGNKVGSLLDIGANDGITLSNSRKLIELGWSADLVEPAPEPFSKLKELYAETSNVNLYNVAISDTTAEMTMYVSGKHLGDNDKGLLSTLSITDKQKWEKYTEFNNVSVNVLKWSDFNKNKNYDFITIDAEGYDLSILQQMDLIELGCSCLCIEHNGIIYSDIMNEIKKYNMRTLLVNHENIIAVI